MQTSTLLKIGIIGMFITVLGAFVPLLAALFGNDRLSQWMSGHINETDATELLLFFSVMIIYSLIKKGRQKYLDDMLNRPGR